MVYPFLSVFGRGMGVDLQALSLALTMRQGVGAFGPFLASVADSRGRKAGMLTGLLMFAGGMGLVAFWPSFPAFAIAMGLSLLGNFVFVPSMQAYLGDRVPYARRGRALAFTEFGWSISFIAGVPLAGLLISRLGWQAPFAVLAVLGLLAVFLLGWLLPGDPAPAGGRPGLRDNFRSVLACPPALLGLAMGLLLSAGNEVVTLVFGVWMEDSFGLQIAALGIASAIFGFSELAGESLVSVVTDRLGKAQAVGAGLALNMLAAMALPLSVGSQAGALAALSLFYITFEFTIVSGIPMMTEVLPQARATLMATFIASMALGRALGDLLGPGLYAHGMLTNASSSVAFNILALLALMGMTRGVRDRG